MDMQSPTRSNDAAPTEASPPFAAALRQLHKVLAAATPAAGADPSERAEALDATHELFAALAPRDAAEAYLAAIAAASAQSALDNFVRAARPGISDDTAIRLRAAGLAAGRAYASAFRTLRRRAPEQPAADPAAEAPSPVCEAAPKPAGDQGEFQPRDRSGKPIPTFRTDLMTRAQVLAVLSYPRDAALEAAAIAEEAAMIAEWAARETPAGGREPDLEPPPGGG